MSSPPPPPTSSTWLHDVHHLLHAFSSPSSCKPLLPTTTTTSPKSSSSSSMAAWIQKRHFVEHIVATLPDQPHPLPCSLLLRLLRLASMVGADTTLLTAIEARTAAQLDHASLEDLLIPAFSHTSGTLLDVDMALRLVRGFVALDDAAKSGAATVKVAKLVDGYLAEAAVDGNLRLQDFEALAVALPAHARACDDGLYRAIDTFLKAHPSTTKHERKALFRLLDTRKLSSEASLHAVQNDRLPVRAVIQVLFSEQSKLSRIQHDWSGSFSGPRSPGGTNLLPSFDLPSSARCPSKREAAAVQQEVRKLREDVTRLQMQCQWLQSQLERVVVVEKRKAKKKGGYSVWRSFWFRGSEGAAMRPVDDDEGILSTATSAAEARRSRLWGGQGKATPPNGTPLRESDPILLASTFAECLHMNLEIIM